MANIIEEDIAAVVAKMQPSFPDFTIQYSYGHPREVARLLAAKDNQVNTTKKYPLIVLVLDTDEQRGSGLVGYNLSIVICTLTKPELSAPQRMEELFKPRLIPLYESFIKSLRKVGLFTWPNMLEEPKHTKTNRYFWGKSDPNGNKAYIFSDPLDAIEIKNLQVNANVRTNC